MKYPRKFINFTDDELYILKRQAIEGSFNIVMLGKYSEDLIQIHQRLLNEVLIEINMRRDEKI